MGMLLLTIGVRDNIELEPNEYRFCFVVRKLSALVLYLGSSVSHEHGRWRRYEVDGIPTIEPVFGIGALGRLKIKNARLKQVVR